MNRIKSALYIMSFLGIFFFSGQSAVMAAPAEPSKFTPSCSSDGTSVTLSWGSVSGNVEYHVRLQQSSRSEQPRNTGSLRSSTYSITAGASHTWWVHAVDNSGWSSWTKRAFSCSPPSPPAAPSGLSHTCNSAGTAVTLRWNNVSGNAGYNVNFSGGNQHSYGTTQSFSTNSGQNYTWRVQTKAAGSAPWSNFSSSRSFSCAAPPPATPSGLSHTCNANGTGVTLRWNSVSGANGYNIDYDGLNYDTAGDNSRYFGVNQNQTYRWRVQSKASSPTPWSNLSAYDSFSCAGPPLPAKPKAPNRPTYECLSNQTQVRVSWNAVSGAIRYPVRLRDSQTGAEIVVNNTNTNTSLVMNTQPEREHTSWVHAENDGGRSIASSPVTFSCPARLAAPFVGNRSGSNSNHTAVLCGGPNNSGSAKQGTDTSATIVWNKVSGATNYPVRIRTKTERTLGGRTKSRYVNDNTAAADNTNATHTFYDIEHDVVYGFWAHAQYTAGNYVGASSWSDYNRLNGGETLFMCAGLAPSALSMQINGNSGTNRTGVFRATDSNNDRYLIEVDTNNDGVADFTSGSGVANTVSGQSVSVAMDFPGPGSYPVRARAVDQHDRKSAWVNNPAGDVIIVATPQCSDGIDNDADGLIDMADPGCTNANDNTENTAVTEGLVDLKASSIQPVAGYSATAGDNLTFTGRVTNIGSNTLENLIYADLELDTNGDGIADRHYNAFGDQAINNVAPGGTRDLSYVLPNVSQGTYRYRFNADTDNRVVESNEVNNTSAWRSFTVAVTPVTTPQCSDGIDNDADGLIDMADPGCTNANDNTENTNVTPEATPQCSDGIDNDADSLIDMADPGCTNANDNTENTNVTPEATPQCSDGIDNDADSLIDMADPGCTNDADNTENTLIPPNMTLTTPQEIISNGSAVVSWNTDASYPMDCTVRGPGMVVVNFDSNVDGTTGNATTTRLTSAGTFELRCIEPISGANHVETLKIEVIGTTQEI